MTGDPHSEPLTPEQEQAKERDAYKGLASQDHFNIERLEAALSVSEASAEELRREVERLNTVTAWYEEKHRQRRAQVYAAEASAQRLTEALGKIASRWGVRTIRPGGRVKWMGRQYVLEDGQMPVEEYIRRFGHRSIRERQPMHDDRPKYDGRMDGMKALLYTYGNHHEGSKTHVYLHSIEGAEWPGPNCVAGYFVWDSFVVAAQKVAQKKGGTE